MTQSSPQFNVSGPEWERTLWWMVLASAGLHVVGITALLLVPHSFLHHPPPMQSYTVDLVAPDQVGGNNMIEGGKGRVQAAPLAAQPPAPEVEPPKAPPQAEPAKPPEPPPPEKKEVVQKPEPPKVEEPPKQNEVALAEKPKKIEPPPVPTAAKVAPSPKAKALPSPKVMAKAEPAKPQPKAPPPVEGKNVKDAAARARDDRIQAAIRKIEQQGGTRGGGTGQKAGETPGGPLSVGPGEGAGGMVKGVEYLIFYNQMINKIKQKWAWPLGARRSLEAEVRFSISEDGQIFDVRIQRSSGDTSFDESVRRAVRAANPLPAPPAAYRKEFADVELTFSPEQLKM